MPCRRMPLIVHFELSGAFDLSRIQHRVQVRHHRGQWRRAAGALSREFSDVVFEDVGFEPHN